MPGLAAPSLSQAGDFMTPFSLFREDISSTDGVSPIDPELPAIDLSKSPSAMRFNKIIVVPYGENSSATCRLALYARFPEDIGVPNKNPLAGRWILVEESAEVDVDTMVQFENIYAAEYAIVVTSLSAGPISLAVSHSPNNVNDYQSNAVLASYSNRNELPV